MVAITVILAAVIGTFVLGLGDDLQDTQPTADFNFNYNEGVDPANVTISHNGGDTVSADNINVVIAGTTLNNESDFDEWSGDISAGSSETLDHPDSNEEWAGESVSVNWESGGSSATLASSTAPE